MSLDSGPIVATIAVVVRDESVLLVRRANPPDAGLWGLPGGKLERGERVADGALRELYEETHIRAAAGKFIDAVDAFDFDPAGNLHRHFVLIALECRWISGEPVAGDDALDARWVPIEELQSGNTAMSLAVAEVVAQALHLASGTVASVGPPMPTQASGRRRPAPPSGPRRG